MAIARPNQDQTIPSAAQMLADARCVVVKVGSALMLDDQGRLDPDRLAALAADMAHLATGDARLVIITSGAVAAGRAAIRPDGVRLSLPERQAAAAYGQIPLFEAWSRALAVQGLKAAQVLLTTDDTEDRRRHLNARATLQILLDRAIVPIINENDTIATQEIRFGDNDRLSARVAQLISADLLVLLSDIDGLYSADPRRDPKARHIPLVEKLNDTVRAMAGGAGTTSSSGGMITKLAAADIATRAGCAMIIADGHVEEPLGALAKGARATVFAASVKPMVARKAWIASTVHHAGSYHLDAGAVAAIERGSSLLPVGVVRLDGVFDKGDPVQLIGPDGRVLGMGLTNYASIEASSLLGRKSVKASGPDGGPDELIHRDNLVHLGQQGQESHG